MSKSNKPLFRSSVGGYNKDDVNVFIQTENRKFAQIEEEYIDKINELSGKLSDAEKKIAGYIADASKIPVLQSEINTLEQTLSERDATIEELRMQIDQLTKEKNEADEKISELSEKCDKLSSENNESEEKYAKLVKDVSDKESEIESLKEDLQSVKAENATLNERLASAEDTPKKTVAFGISDEEKQQISDMLAKAKAASEDILRKAEAGAELILDKAKKEVNNYRSRTITDAKEVFDAATEELRRSIAICMNDFVTSLKNNKGDPARTAETAYVCDDDLGRRIERMQNELDRAIAEKLAEFDNRN